VSRSGRRPGVSGTRERIIDCARRAFATRGYDATTLRVIAADAAVDPSLLIHYFKSKQGLFVEAMGFPIRPSETLSELAAVPLRQASERLVTIFVAMIDSEQSRNAMLALVRSAVSNEQAATVLREFVTAELLSIIATLTPHDDAALRASLVASQLVGIAMLRHVVRVGPLARAAPEAVVALVAPVLEEYLR
jgi:AcrR family transcriptional regulator